MNITLFRFAPVSAPTLLPSRRCARGGGLFSGGFNCGLNHGFNAGVFRFALVLGWVFVFAFAGVASAAAATSNSPAAKNAKAEPAVIEPLVVQPPFIAPPVPQAVFVMPKSAAEGRDPFFPKSTRVYGSSGGPTNKTAVVSPVAELSLKGISGTDAEPLAIINTTTFAAGEDNDVLTKAGRMRIRCVEINKAAGTVIVQVGGERRELRLAPPPPLTPQK